MGETDSRAGSQKGGRIVGIDLGTTNSLIAVMDDTGPRVLGGDRAVMPSVVRYERSGDGSVRAVVGERAREEAIRYPASTISSVKRLMGRSVEDASGDAAVFSYGMVAGPRSTSRVVIPVEGGDDIVLTPEEVSADILRELKRRAEEELGEGVSRAVITVPAYFDDAQRQATRDAARLAGLEVARLVNEPTAAALAYGVGGVAAGEDRTIAVYDLGGGTFDVSILRIIPPDPDAPELGEGLFQVIATSGDTRLGGDDADAAIMSMLADEMSRELGGEVSVEGLAGESREALRSFARSVKHRLSDEEDARVEIDMGGGRSFGRSVTREELESLLAPIVEKTVAPCERALRDAKEALRGEPVDAVVLVGGSTRSPLVRRKAEVTFGIEPYTAIDPDRAVAIGAAQQAGIIERGERGEIAALLLDVVPLSLGIETAGGAMAKLIMRNSAAPSRATEMFSTSKDGQVSIKLHVLQGEREMASDCRSLGEFHLEVPPMPAGMPQVEVEFLVDVNGVLRVRAEERRSGRVARMEVVPSHGLTRDEVDRIEAESIEHAREDMTRHRIADLVANSTLDVGWIRDRLAKHGDGLDASVRDELAAMCDELSGMVASAEADWRSVDAGSMQRLKEKLDRASIPLQEVAITRSLQEES